MARQSGEGVAVLGNIRVRKDLGDLVLALLEDPMKPGKVKYGSMRMYLERLIAKDMRERQAIAEVTLNKILESTDEY